MIEFQKLGLPQLHTLIYLAVKDQLHDSDQIVKIISAEIQDENIYPNLYNFVKQHMIHGPCGTQNKISPYACPTFVLLKQCIDC